MEYFGILDMLHISYRPKPFFSDMLSLIYCIKSIIFIRIHQGFYFTVYIHIFGEKGFYESGLKSCWLKTSEVSK